MPGQKICGTTLLDVFYTPTHAHQHVLTLITEGLARLPY